MGGGQYPEHEIQTEIFGQFRKSQNKFDLINRRPI